MSSHFRNNRTRCNHVDLSSMQEKLKKHCFNYKYILLSNLEGKMKTLTVKAARRYLDEASDKNPGEWVFHSTYVAQGAKTIAKNIGLDPELAEAYGLIHDIGRYVGVVKIRHSIEGYKFMLNEGYDEAASICLTHSFPTFEISDMIGEWDATNKDYQFATDFLKNHNVTQMDKLIQFCDAIALHNGFTLMERRLADVMMRYGCDSSTVKRWKAYYSLQMEFEQELGKSIYSLFPSIEKSITELKIIDSLPYL